MSNDIRDEEYKKYHCLVHMTDFKELNPRELDDYVAIDRKHAFIAGWGKGYEYATKFYINQIEDLQGYIHDLEQERDAIASDNAAMQKEIP